MVDTPLNAYLRVPPPTDPDSSQSHLDGELYKLERTTRETIARLGTISTTYAPLNGVGTSGTWPISISGSSGASVNLVYSGGQSITPSGNDTYVLTAPASVMSASLQLKYNATATAGYLYGDSSGGFGFLSPSHGWQFRTDSSGATSYGYLQALTGGVYFPDGSLQPTALSIVTGAVGSYGFFYNASGTDVTTGSSVAGSSLYWFGTGGGGGSPSGTWRCMGYGGAGYGSVYVRYV